MKKMIVIRNWMIRLFVKVNLVLLNLVLYPAINYWMKLLVKLNELCFSLDYDYLEKNNLLDPVLSNYMMQRWQPYFDRMDNYDEMKPITYMSGNKIKYTDDQNEIDPKQLQNLIDQLQSSERQTITDLFENTSLLDEETEISEEEVIETSNDENPAK